MPNPQRCDLFLDVPSRDDAEQATRELVASERERAVYASEAAIPALER